MKRLLLLVPLLLFVAACGEEHHHDHMGIGSMSPIEVAVQTEPSAPQAGQAVTIGAEVTQDGKPVDDADEVLFEIWPEGADEFAHEEIEGALDKEGVYTIDYTFPESGKYYIVAHVTARTFHTMPKIELVVE